MNYRSLMLAGALVLAAAPAAAQTHDSVNVRTPADTILTPRTDAAPRPRRARGNFNLISEGDVQATQATDALQLVQNLRPAWLRVSRGLNSFSSPQDVVVFRNGLRMGGRDALSSIPVATIVRIRMYSATEARQKFGGETSGGAIDVTTR